MNSISFPRLHIFFAFEEIGELQLLNLWGSRFGPEKASVVLLWFDRSCSLCPTRRFAAINCIERKLGQIRGGFGTSLLDLRRNGVDAAWAQVALAL